MKKKLYWIDYSTSGHALVGGPMISPYPFEHVGFEVEFKYWYPPDVASHSAEYQDDLLVEIEARQPNIVLFMFNGNWATETSTDEPAELIRLCEQVQKSSKLGNTKTMAFFRIREVSSEKKAQWDHLYDFHALLPFKIIEHAKVAKQLVGEQSDDIEGAIYYLTTHGSWEIYSHTNLKTNIQLDAVGKFSNAPKIRLLTSENDHYRWTKLDIKPNLSTKIVFSVKDLINWKGGLLESEIQVLKELAINDRTTNSQLLLGVNSALLDAQDTAVVKVINQAINCGGWKIFIIEHLWLENHWFAFYDNLLYEKDHLEPRTIDALNFISL